MTVTASIDQANFRNILKRNISLPLGIGALSAMIFVGLIFFLLSTLNWVDHSQRVIGNANETAKLSIDMETGMRGFLITGDETFLQPYEIARSRMMSELTTLKDLVGDNPSQVDRLKRIEGLQTQWNAFAREVIDKRRNNQAFDQDIRLGRGKGLTDEIRREFSGFIMMEQRLLQQRSEEARSTTQWSVAAYLAFTLGLSGLLAFFGRRELLRLSETYAVALKQQAEDAEVLQEVGWLRSGQTRLAEQMIGQQALAPLGRSALDFLAHYLGVAVAALYVREDTGRLQRVAAYGFSKEVEDKPQAFYSADGLVGQAALENRVLQLDELPENYLTVTSGLGQTAPRHVLIVPVVHDGQVNGVAELAFLRALNKRDLEFVKLVAGSIGTAIHGALVRERVQNLLVETQQLNEELQVQQEELRTANEELEEQSRVLKESQANLENQQAELEQTNEQLAEQALKLDQKNSALNEAQVALEERASELTRASRYKSEFLANMSHELRTPLNSILVLGQQLSENPEGNLTPKQVEFSKTIHGAGTDLLNLISDILDLSKIESGTVSVEAEEIYFNNLQEVVVGPFRLEAERKHLNFETRVDPGLGRSMITDSKRLRQILKNLLSNAFKFTEQGGVRFTVQHVKEGWSSDHPTLGHAPVVVAFAVSDTGIGISPEKQRIIFEAFQQADASTSRKYGGTGLGLAISRELSNLLGGEIQLSSAPGVGSTFTLYLPLNYVGPATPQRATAPAGGPAHIAAATAAVRLAELPSVQVPDDRDVIEPGDEVLLIVEDDPHYARIMADLARDQGLKVLVAMRGADALNLAREFQPSAVSLDVFLPDMLGWTVLSQLKQNPTTRHIPVQVVTMDEDRQHALQRGAFSFITKPATKEGLEAALSKIKDFSLPRRKRLLVVEDNAAERLSISELLGHDDIDILPVETGAEALRMLREEVFDCIVLDLKLPDMSGFEFLEQIRADDKLSEVPVVVFTGRQLSPEEDAQLHTMARSVVVKGVESPERLLDETALFLHRVVEQLPSEKQRMLERLHSSDEDLFGRTVLLIDDDARNIFALSSVLERRGMKVLTATTGREGIDVLEATDDVAIVLTDIMMPEMDGYETIQRMRKNPKFRRLPIVALTAKAMKGDREKCLEAGASDYLAKPVNTEQLLSALRMWLHR